MIFFGTSNFAGAGLFKALTEVDGLLKFEEINQNYPDKRSMSKTEAAAILRTQIYQAPFTDVSFTADEEGFIILPYRGIPFKIRFATIAYVRHYKNTIVFYGADNMKLLIIVIDATSKNPDGAGANRKKLFGSVLSKEGMDDFFSALLTLCPNVR